MSIMLNGRDSHVLNPLFWQKGSSRASIRTEMERMKAAGINDVIVEARPHPDYLGEGWWEDLRFLLKEADRLDLLIWIFDDGHYPSGSAYGKLAKLYPGSTKRYWREDHIDASGPLPHAHFLIGDWLNEGESVYRVLAARRTDRGQTIDSDTLTDLTDHLESGRLYWPVPEGDWRIFLIRVSPKGDEEHTQDYVDPLSTESVDKYIDLVHEAHYAHFADRFGTRIAGFFTDEPRFGNTVGYDRIVGRSRMPLPYTKGMEPMLSKTPLGDLAGLLPLLWYEDIQGRFHDVRYAYMDVVSRLFADCFTGRIGAWCRARGVKLIGHVVEENGAHSRLGYGPGHWFRAMEGLDAAGIDVVCNLYPGQTSGSFATAFNEYDCDFNHWGLGKMASSAAQTDPKKHGDTLCEAFGAYGWSEGLRLMKWITDRLAVQGINIITPHAFSPAPFPDPDCPPHFYAGGENPQFRLFPLWSRYAQNLLEPLRNAKLIAPVAVLYHAEAEWGGECEPFEKAVKVLAQQQIDCAVLPIDLIMKEETRTEHGILFAGGLEFRALVIPRSRFLPGAFAEKLQGLIRKGLPVFFTHALPERVYFGSAPDLDGARVCKTEDLPDAVKPYADIVCTPSPKDLCYTHMRKDGVDLYLFVNQSVQEQADCRIRFPDKRPALIYDPMGDRSARPDRSEEGLRLVLAPWESRFVIFGLPTEGLPDAEYPRPEDTIAVFPDGWRISVAEAREYPSFRPTPFTRTGDLSRLKPLRDFSGTVRYERTFALEDTEALTLDLGDAFEAAEVWINDRPAGSAICPPYRFPLDPEILHRGENRIRIEVTNTLIKTQHGDPFSRWFPQEPTGLAEPPSLLKRKSPD